MRAGWVRLIDIVAAADAIISHLTRGDLRDELIFDAVKRLTIVVDSEHQA